MKTFYAHFIVLLVLFFTLPQLSRGQTPGLITKPANNGGQAVLDPNGDGYVSKTRAGFTSRNDEGAAYSEVPYRFFPAMSNEVLGDLDTGTFGGHTDYAPSESDINTGSPAASYFDGTHFMFRKRLGGASSASKGYSVLIDTDGQFPGGAPNPGFEYEVVLAANFGVQVIKHSASGQQEVIYAASQDQNSQKSIAASRASNDPDFFYDFYVPLTAFQGGITTKTPLRMSAVTITSAQSGLSGTISDVAGLNFKEYGYDPFKAWLDIINAFPPTSLDDIQAGEFPKVTAVPPIVNDPIYTTNTTITGTSIEVAGSIIEVYRTRMVNGTLTTVKIGETTVRSDGTWILTGVTTGTLAVNDEITATVTPFNKDKSGISNKVIVQEGMCTSAPPPVITGIYNEAGGIKGITGTTTYNGPQTINIYHSSNTKAVLYSISYTPAPGTNAPYPWSLSFETKDKSVNTGLYTATITPQGGCESINSNQVCYRNGNSGTLNSFVPSINQITLKDGRTQAVSGSTTSVPANIRTITGTLSSFTSGVTIEVLVDAVIQTNVTVVQQPGSGSPHTWIIDISNLNLNSGDLINVRSKIPSSDCGAILSSPSNFMVVTTVTAAPAINAGPYCGVVSSISGTSTEQAGTVIEIYSNGVATGRTGKVTVSGKWTVDLSTLSGGGIAPGVNITARARAVDKMLSPVSNTVVSSQTPNGTITISPVTEGQTIITGTAPASNESIINYVSLSVDGVTYPEVQTDAAGNWTVNNISSFDVYPGATISATYRNSNLTCPSRPVSVTVACSKPIKYNTSPDSATICYGETVQVTLQNSQPNIYYNLMNGGVQSGSSVIGTGGSIMLTSDPLFTSTTLTVEAHKVGSSCSENMNGSTTVTVNPLPVASAINFTPTGIYSECPDTFMASLAGSNSAYNYQLITTDGQLVGSPVRGISGGVIQLSTGFVLSTTTFNVRVSDPSTGCYITVTEPAFTVTINGPVLTHSVTPAYQTVCLNATATVVVSSSETGYTYQLKRSSDNTPVSDPVIGTGSQLNIVTYPFTTAGINNYYVAVRKTVGACINDFRLLNEVTIEVIGDAVSTSSSDWSIKCGQNLTATLNGNAPPQGGSGVWALSSTQYTTGSGVIIVSPNSPTTSVTGLNSGTYTFTWTVTASCGSNTTTSISSVTITVNCPGYYEVAPSKYADQHRTGDVLAVAKDQDNGVASAKLVPGFTVPPGTTINPTTGVITVSNPSVLVAGTYTFQVDLVDGNGFTTRVPVTLRFLTNGSSNDPLPIELLYFRGNLTQGVPSLEWATATVKGSVHFDIERSADAKNFIRIGTLQKGSESSMLTKYSYLDKTATSGVMYYRLQLKDASGQAAVSKVVVLKSDGHAQTKLQQVYPNPFKDSFNISVDVQQAGELTMQLVNMQGQVVHQQSEWITSGSHELELKTKHLNEGIYILKLSGTGLNQTIKVVKASN